MNYKKVVDTAMLAGELMIIGGAEIYRVEDTMNHILEYAKNTKHTVFALSTGITLTMWVENETITVSKRVTDRESNLNYIDKVNMVSRSLCNGSIDIDSAYESLKSLRNKYQFSQFQKFFAYVAVCFGFTQLYGGDLIDILASAITGISLAAMYFLLTRMKVHSFVKNMLSTLVVVLVANILKVFVFVHMNIDLVIIGAIMPLVPGMSFTTAMRDTLYGDYISGMGRVLEAIVIALAVATGAGIAIWFFHGFLVG